MFSFCVDRQTDRQTERQTDSETDRQTDTGTDAAISNNSRHTQIQIIKAQTNTF